MEQLLGSMTPSTFVEQHYLKFPYAMPGAAAAFQSLGTWSTVREILAQSDVDAMTVRRGELHSSDAAPTYDQARSLYTAGFTLVIRHAERHHPELNRVAAGFREDFAAPVDIHLYCTPPGQSGFGWHYDAEEVFIIQTVGSKEYAIRKNTVNPWPVLESLPGDMHYEREIMPVMRCTLRASDWIYIPSGYWHKAYSSDATLESISLAIGVLATPAIAVLDQLRSRLLSSLLWRQRLPNLGRAMSLSRIELIQLYRNIFRQLGDDLSREIVQEDFVRHFIHVIEQSSSEPDGGRR